MRTTPKSIDLRFRFGSEKRGGSVRRLSARIVSALFLFALLASVSFLYADGEDWGYRGNRGHTGYSPDSGPEDAYVNWVFRADERFGTSSPVISNGIIYIADLPGRVYAVNAQNAAVIWKSDLKAAVSSSVTADGGSVFVIAEDGYIHCLNSADGKYKWARNLGGSSYSSPILDGGDLFVASDAGIVFSFDPSGGEVKWLSYLEGSIPSTPLPTDNLVIVPATTRTPPVEGEAKSVGKLFFLDRTTGKVTKRILFPSGFNRNSAALYGDQLFIGCTDGNLYAFDRKEGKELWKSRTGGPIESDPLVWGEKIYTGSSDGTLYAMKRSNGEVEWKTALGGPVVSSPVGSGNYLVFTAYSKKKGDETIGVVKAVSALDGKVKWEFPTGGPIQSNPALYGGKLYIASGDWKLYAFVSP